MNVTELANLQMRYGLSRAQAQILILLAENPVVSPQMIELDRGIVKDARVGVYRLRARLAATGIVVKQQYALGYWLEQGSRDLVHAAMQPPKGLPLGDGGKGDTVAA